MMSSATKNRDDHRWWFVFVIGIAAVVIALWLPAAGAQERVLEGHSLLGEPMYAPELSVANQDNSKLFRAIDVTRAEWERNPTVDTATLYGRYLGYAGYRLESIKVYDKILKRYPDAAKLYRHRAHRYLSLREFQKSVTDGLKAAELYKGKPLEREQLGPDFYPGDPDVVQFYVYYHLGAAYFALHDFDNAAEWFSRARQVAKGTEDPPGAVASIYWQYLSLARGQRYDEAASLLASSDYTLDDLRNNTESNYYFDNLQLFRGRRDPATFYSTKGTDKPFSGADAIASSSAYTLANYYLIRADEESAKEYLRKAININSWGFFARIMAESDWRQLYGDEKP